MEIRTIRLQNLKRLIEENLTIAAVARASDASEAYLSQILNATPLPSGAPRGVGSALARKLEKGCEKPRGWMDVAHNEVGGEESNVQAIPGSKEVPLISWVQAGKWSEIIDNFEPGDAEEWLLCPVKHSKSTIALTVSGDSMYAPGERYSYANGDIIFVDPERVAENGSRIVVRRNSQNTATFKQLVEEDGRRLLKALNPLWPDRYLELMETDDIVGVVIAKLVRE